jgi:hypothetical protein
MKSPTSINFASLLALLSLLLAGLFSPGCSSLGKPASASFASVLIPGQSARQIQETTIAVFREKGYRAYASGQQLVFERDGTRAETISRDGLVAAHYGAVTILRVRVDVEDFNTGPIQLKCQAYMVSNAADGFMENEARLASFRSGPYQDLLDEVAKRLKQP